ncbi:hypothetical protein ACOSP7_001683 [Xanthoceras sorbifolium]
MKGMSFCLVYERMLKRHALHKRVRERRCLFDEVKSTFAEIFVILFWDYNEKLWCGALQQDEAKAVSGQIRV